MNSKAIFFLIQISILTACSKPSDSFDKLDCKAEGSSINSNLRRVFKPCREYIFSARYWDKNYNLISEEKIWMMATGKEWAYEPDTQDEIAIQYEVDESKIDFIKSYGINPEFDQTDVALVIGANDVINPSARDQHGRPIYGMPILDVD